jgi:hypothetical protein
MPRRLSLSAIILLFLTAPALAKGPAYTDPAKTDTDFPFQGEYVGIAKTNNGDLKIGVQVIALGEGNFTRSAAWVVCQAPAGVKAPSANPTAS